MYIDEWATAITTLDIPGVDHMQQFTGARSPRDVDKISVEEGSLKQ